MKRPLMVGLMVLAGGVAGCGESRPTLAGGKPVAHWVEALHDPDARVRKKAAFKLGNVGTADPTALPALVAALGDRDAAVRGETILALMKFGPVAREALPPLTELQRRDPDARVRQYATRAVERLATP